MSSRTRGAALGRLLIAAAALIVVGTSISAAAAVGQSSKSHSAWPQRNLTGLRTYNRQVPRVVRHGLAPYLHAHQASSRLTLNFGLPLRDKAGLDRLIQEESWSHSYPTRAELYARFSPSKAQYNALRVWLTRHGFRVTHLGRDRLMIAASAKTSTIQRALHTKIADFVSPGFKYQRVKVKPFVFFANTKPASLPARFGVQTVSGLTNVARFFTDYTLAHPSTYGHEPLVRSGGYFPTDLRGLYNITGHGFDGTGQTLGFTLWTAAERQAAMTKFATDTGDQLITVDPSCTASGNSPTTPSSCSTQAVAGDHLMSILENGNTDSNSNFGSNVETALDIEAAHGIATHAGLKYYASECAANPPANTGLANAGCNGTDVGMEDAMEDAANDPTLHSVSNSWAYGGEAEWGPTDPFVVATGNILALGAAAGTTFYYSTGDSGTYESGYPSDSPYVVSVGGTSTYSTSSSATWSTSATWNGGGSWCSTQYVRPAWQTGAGVAANASCPGRVIPDESAVADPNTGVRFTSSTNLTGGTSSGQVGGTSLAAPVLNGLQAVTQNFVNAQTYPGATPHIGFMSPLLYQLGNSGHADSYFRDVQCGNTANPTSGPDGDASIRGWDAATGWGEPDWFNFSTGIAQLLGATNVSTPATLSRHFSWTCAKTPSNSTERAFSCPTASVCYAVGASSGGTPWYGKFITSGAWGAVNTIFKSTDGGRNWFPSNSDMFSIACTSSSTCMTVGAGGRERRTTDGGSTWSDVATAPGNNKPLTQVECPSSSICYAVGDRGNIQKSTDGGQTWSWEFGTTYGNPMYGLSCPSTTTCYATDIYAHVFKTTDGGATWAAQVTPITTPYAPVVAETGGPNPWGGLTGISCPSAGTCVGVGIYASVTGQTNPNPDPPIVTTTDGGTTWTRQVSGAGTGNFLQAVTCLPGTTTCWAVGRAGKIETTTDLVTWTAQTSGTTNYLNSVYCSSASFCIAVGQNGTVDVYNGTTWTATTANGGTGTLADVTCDGGSLVCYATGKQGITLLTTTGGSSWTIQAGGGSQANQLNGISCPSTGTCYTAGAAGTLLKTTNGGQSWLAQTSGTTSALNGIACVSGNSCTAVGAAGTARATSDGSTWNAGTSGTTNALNWVSCASASSCVAVGASGTARASADVGATWSAGTTGTTVSLNAVSCPAAGACYAAGATGTILKSTDGGATWSALASGTTATLNGVACSNTLNCIVDGTTGLISSTSNGSTWSQQGNPDSGPTTAQNATSVTLNGSLCTSVRCLVGTGAQGDILISVTTPTTTASVSPTNPNGLNGWYVTAPTVTLTATAGDLPVASTHYSIDGGPDQTYTGPFSISTDGSHTVSYYSVDTDGNAETPQSITVKVDLNNPTSSATITPAIHNGWYASPTVTLTGNDGSGSGIDHISYKIDGEASWHTYTGPLSGFSTGNHFVQFQATDVAGRVESSVNLIAFKADSDKPTVTITRPADGASYKLGQVVNANYKCADKLTGSGIDSCVGTVPNGSPIDTSSVGSHSFTVTATDKAGNQTVKTVHYSIRYAWTGFYSPISNSGSGLNLVHAGDLIKLGFGLGGNYGLGVLAAGSPSSVPVSCPAETPHLVAGAHEGTPPGLSYGISSSHYSYGWQTDSAWAGTCRQFSLQVKDGTAPHTAVFEFFA
ncbi:MAG: OmpL47-type beta-barrel domain-containing protein [Gaiellaceae bacterium]